MRKKRNHVFISVFCDVSACFNPCENFRHKCYWKERKKKPTKINKKGFAFDTSLFLQ